MKMKIIKAVLICPGAVRVHTGRMTIRAIKAALLKLSREERQGAWVLCQAVADSGIPYYFNQVFNNMWEFYRQEVLKTPKPEWEVYLA